MNLYLKYRPRTIDELDLLRVREDFGRIISSNNLSHAYLFTGPRGAGKTSSARILARVVNCDKNKDILAEPCNECSSCKEILSASAMDVIEIDAASNRGIDDIRELKEKIRLAPISLRYKVYIIDEVHMLTTEAFNALLKTLEEPPAHSLFILCTTELHKVPETIVSRCTQINFYKASSEELARSMARVLLGEGVVVDDSILKYVGSHVDGSFRDGVKYLEQVLSIPGEITLEKVVKMLSGGVGYNPEVWVAAMLAHDTEQALSIVSLAINEGIDLTYFLVSAMQVIRSGLLASYKIGESKLVVDVKEAVLLVSLLDKTAKNLSQAPLPELLVEAMVIEWSLDKEPKKSKTKDIPEPPVASKIEEPKEEALGVYEDILMDGAQIRSLWRKMIANLDKREYSLEALLSKASPSRVEGRNLIVSVAYDFHKAQLMTTRFRDSVEAQVKEAYGMPLSVMYEVAKSDDTIVENANDIVSAAEEIFVN